MARPRRPAGPARPTDGELRILRVLWARGPSTVRQVHETLAGPTGTTYSTTLKLLQIMLDKHLVTRQDTHRPQIYQAATPEDRMQQQLVSDLLDRAFGGARRKLVAAMTAGDISDEELADIRRLFDEYGEKHDGHAD